MSLPIIRSSVKSFAVLGFWAVFLSAYFERFPIPGLLGYIAAAILGFAVWGSAAGYGIWLSRAMLPSAGVYPLETFIFASASGWGFLSLTMAALGWAGAWTRPAIGLLVTGGLISGWVFLHRFVPVQSLNVWPADRKFSVSQGLVMVGGVLSLLLCFTPITYYDSLVYHLALPLVYEKAGRWVALPELIYSAFPQNLEMLWLAGRLLAHDTVSNVIGWTLTASLAAAVFSFTSRFVSTASAWWATAMVAVMPAILLLSSGGYVDTGLAFFSFLSLYSVFLWREAPTRRLALLAGLLGGIATGIKYTGALSVFAAAILLVCADARLYWRRNLAHGLVLFAGAYGVFLPWMLKNLFVMGNPVFPFFHQWSMVELNPWVGQAAEGYFQGLTEYTPRSGFETVRLLWDVAVHGLNFGGGMDVLGDLGWALLLAGLPLLWLCAPLSTAIQRLMSYAILFYVPWAMSRPVLRFLIPLAPVLAVLSGVAWTQGLEKISSRSMRFIAQAVFASLLVSGLFLFVHTAGLLGSYRVVLGLESMEGYLSHRLTYYRAARFVNTLPESTLTYVVGDQRGYYYDRPVIVTPVFNRNPLTDWANNAASVEALRQSLKDHEVTHLLINFTEMKRLEHYRIFPFTPAGEKNWQGLLRQGTTLLYQDDHCRVYEL